MTIPDEVVKTVMLGKFRDAEMAVLHHALVSTFGEGKPTFGIAFLTVAEGSSIDRSNIKRAVKGLVGRDYLKRDGELFSLGRMLVPAGGGGVVQPHVRTFSEVVQPHQGMSDGVVQPHCSDAHGVVEPHLTVVVGTVESSAHRNAGAGAILSKKKNEVLSASGDPKETEADRLASEVRGIVAKHKLGTKVLADNMATQARNLFLRERFSPELIKAEINAVGMTTKYGSKWPVFVAANLAKGRTAPVEASPAVVTPVPSYLKRAVPPGPQGLRPKPQPRVTPDAHGKSPR